MVMRDKACESSVQSHCWEDIGWEPTAAAQGDLGQGTGA